MVHLFQELDLIWWEILAVIGIGMLAGFINTLAGSGSLLTLPLLMFLGLPANVANGTNRIAILLQNVVGAGSFKKHKVLDIKQGLYISLMAVAGSILGARIAVGINDAIMGKAIGALLIAMFFLIIFKPARWLSGQKNHSPLKLKYQLIILDLMI